ncbi:MAG: hypothetical protein VYC42_06615, partial [Pseudomonadota bacterium]|nr:hypothetical protein [Pseudomonadota bacterium]
NSLGAPLGGTPLTIVELFGDTPRALAVSPDGKTVYAAVFASGTRTTTIPQPIVSNNGGLPPQPDGATPGWPEVGLIVKYDGAKWVDEVGRDWSAHVPFSLPDYDVFRVDATASPPVETGRISGVGAVIYNMAVRPTDGRLFVTNTDALNEERFETALNGRFAPNQITVINGTTREHVVHINPHIDYGHETGPAGEVAQSLATPMQLVFTPDGKTAYVAAFGSAKVGVFDADALAQGRSQRSLIDVGMGPSGLALDASRDRLYVINRIDHTLSIVDKLSSASRSVATMNLPYNPEPESLTAGRKFLYDASDTSGHGDVSCHSCHVFGDVDHLAWDLGNPFGQVTENPNIRNPAATGLAGGLGGVVGPGGSTPTPFHPMKGPMTTQSLRGLAGAGPMHWRGDKTGGLTPEGEVDPDGDPLDENAAFVRFNAAFTGLQGRAEQLSDDEMQTFAHFMLQVVYPPSPIRELDNGDTEAQAQGRDLFMDNDLLPLEDDQACASCHVLPLTTNGTIARTAQISSEQADFKIAHLRNVYQKVGMFGAAEGAITGTREEIVGEQVRGFGLTHDGSISDLTTFLRHPQNLFTPLPNANGLNGAEKRRNVGQFILAMDTGLAPIVGQQLTVSGDGVRDAALTARLNLLIARAEAGDADLVVKGVWDGAARGALYDAGRFRTDRAGDSALSVAELLAFAQTGALTFTAVPPGSGTRIGIDRNEDGTLDADEKSVPVSGGASGETAGGGALGPWTLLLLMLATPRRRVR